MALDADHAALFGEGHELVLEVLITRSHDEADVHDRTVFLRGGADEERVAVDLVVEQLGFLDVHLVHHFQAAQALEPFQRFGHHEDREHRRGVEHRTAVDMGLVVEHRREVAGDLAEDVLADDGEDHAGRTDVLLGAAIDESVLGDIHRTAHDVGRHIGHEVDRAVHVVFDLGTVDRVVGRDVEVVEVGRDLIAFRDVAVGLVGRGGDADGIADALGFLERLLGPDTRLQVAGLVLEEVHRHIEELERSAAAEEDHFIVVGNVEELFPECAALVHRLLPFLRTVRHRYDRHAGTFEVLQCCNRCVNRLLRKNAGTCVEIVSFFHKNMGLLKVVLWYLSVICKCNQII